MERSKTPGVVLSQPATEVGVAGRSRTGLIPPRREVENNVSVEQSPNHEMFTKWSEEKHQG
jgi:hypothetical protein